MKPTKSFAARRHEAYGQAQITERPGGTASGASMKAVVLERCGEPPDALRVRDVPRPEPARGQVRVRMIATPINPSDLLLVRGRYLQQPPLPYIPGFEGVGIVEASGGDLLGRVRQGRRVAVINPGGACWAEYVVVPSAFVFPVASDLADEQAATFMVNPMTVVGMIRWVLRVKQGAWLLQTAAASALGQMIIRLAQRDGFRTINVVRRRDQADELRSHGADVVICSDDGESIEDRVREVTRGTGVRYALDAIGGGEPSAALLRALAAGGHMLVYGLLGGESLHLDARELMASRKIVQGFWMTEWSLALPVLSIIRLWRQIARLFQERVFRSDIAAWYPLEEVQQATAHADTPGRRGKILLRASSG